MSVENIRRKNNHSRRRSSFSTIVRNAAIGGTFAYGVYRLYNSCYNDRNAGEDESHTGDVARGDDDGGGDEDLKSDNDKQSPPFPSSRSFFTGSWPWRTDRTTTPARKARGPGAETAHGGPDPAAAVGVLFSASFASDFLPLLRKNIDGRCSDGSAAVKNLKRMRRSRGAAVSAGGAQEMEMWETLRRAVVRRLFLTFYGTTISGLVLSVQTHGVAARRRTDVSNDGGCDGGPVGGDDGPVGGDDDARRRRNVLKFTYSCILGTFLGRLADEIEKLSVKPTDSNSPDDDDVTALDGDGTSEKWSMSSSNPLSFEELYSELLEVRKRIEIPQSSQSGEGQWQSSVPEEGPSPLQTLIVCSYEEHRNNEKEHGVDDDGRDAMDGAVDATCDMVESPVFRHALTDCLDETWEVFCRQHVTTIFGGGPGSSCPDKLPLAQIVPKLRNCTGRFYGSSDVRSSKVSRGGTRDKQIDLPLFVVVSDGIPSVRRLVDTAAVDGCSVVQ